MTRYTDSKSLRTALAAAAPGDERAQILYEGYNRALVLNSGANVTLYTGDAKTGATMAQRLDDISLMLIDRIDPRIKMRDGLGALGGMSERTTLTVAEFNALPAAEKARLAAEKDDVLPYGDSFALTQSIDLIALRTVRREMREELSDLGVDLDSLALDMKNLKRVPLRGVQDDNFLLRIWGGNKDTKTNPDAVYAVSPYCHVLKLVTADFNRVAAATASRPPSHEAHAVRPYKLFDALSRWGKVGGGVATHRDAADMEYNYRYPHEWLSSWHIASDALGYDPAALIDLAREVQEDIYKRGHNYRLSFTAVAGRMHVPLETIDDALEAPAGTAARMQAAINAVPRP